MPTELSSEQRELAEASAFFAFWPKATKYSKKSSGLSASFYKRADGSIIRMGKTLGAGHFGKVKLSQFSDEGFPSVIKQLFFAEKNLENALKAAKDEANINSDLRDRPPSRVIKKLGHKNKIYQSMPYLGQTLTDFINDNKEATQNQKLDIAIKLLLEVHKLHSGEASRTGKQYAHRDIKPDNVVIEAIGQVHLIDFGFAEQGVDMIGVVVVGTLAYLPVDQSIVDRFKSQKWDSLTREDLEDTYEERRYKTTRAQEDMIATLRVIFNPKSDSDSPTLFKDFPSSIREYLDTTIISNFFEKAPKAEAEQFYAALLIAYQANPDINKDEIEALMSNVGQQKKLIQDYQLKPIRSQVVEGESSEEVLAVSDKPTQKYMVAAFWAHQKGLLPKDENFSSNLELIKNSPKLQEKLINQRTAMKKWLMLPESQVLSELKTELEEYKNYLEKKFIKSSEKLKGITDLLNIFEESIPDPEKLKKLMGAEKKFLSLRTHKVIDWVRDWFSLSPHHPKSETTLASSFKVISQRFKKEINKDKEEETPNPPPTQP